MSYTAYRKWLGTTAIGLVAALAAPAVAADAANRTVTTTQAALSRTAASSPIPQQALETARGRLESSIGQLEKFLVSLGSSKEQLWRQWLELPGLEAELVNPQPDPAILTRHLARLCQDQPGLELPAFVPVRRELRHYLAAHDYAATDDPGKLFGQRLELLADCLARLDVAPTAEDARQAGRLIAWLESLGGQAATLATTVRAQYCRGNAIGQFSARLANLLLERSVAEQQFIAEEILGSYTQGTAFTQAQVSFGFVPSHDHATLALRMVGRTVCPANVAQRRRVSVYSSADTAIHADKHVYLDEEGLQLSPASALCSTNLQINDVEAGRRIVERLAWRRVDRMTPEAQDAAAERARAEASGKLDQQAATALAGVNDTFRGKIRAPLIRHDAYPSQWLFWTDRDHLRISLAQHNDAQLAVASPAPSFPAGYDLAIGAHESMIVNLCEAMLAGATIKDRTWLELVKLLTGDEPRVLWVHDRSEPWSVTLADELPLLAHFDSNRIEFTLRLKKLTRGADVFEHPVEIEARFVMRSTSDGPALARDGELAVRFLDMVETPQREQTRAFLLRKFGAVFPPELVFHGLMPPAGGSLAKLNALELAEFKSAAGWLTFGYRLGHSESVVHSGP